MKLYRVKLRGMQTNITGIAYGVAYVVANDPQEAYNKVRTAVDEEDLGFRDERELSSVELLAEDAQYPQCRMRLYL